MSAVGSLSPFVNEPFLDFTVPANAEAMRAAIAAVRGQLGVSYELLIGGKAVATGKTFASTNPAKPAEVIGVHAEASEADALAAIEAAETAFATWGKTSVAERVELLLKTSKLLQERHFEFCAWLTVEVGKNWAEADADVGECIDFLEFYAREALKLDGATTPIQYPGEKNMLRYVPLGLGAVIPPWNFPLAIMAGMTMAAVVTGNTVVLKPSPDAPTIAAQFVKLLQEAGLPAGVVNLVQGGPAVGNALVESTKVRFIAFTGSMKVGLEIHEKAAKTPKGQRFLKRTILELGGKDSIVVDADANVDDAVAGVVASAFGFNGQKCSACSRAIVEDSIYEEFTEKLKVKVEALKSGDPAENFALGPLVNGVAKKRVLSYIETGKGEGKLLTGGAAIEQDGGFFVEPTVFTEIPATARLAQEEIFGPVLAVIRAKDFEDALAIANDTEYGLTGAIYTSSAEKLERARREFHVGNLYLNRKCTGAMVGAHPFGGFNLSGTDSKAGGPDYLLLFTQAKSIAERL